MNKNFSIILNSRKRINLLNDLLYSLNNNAKNKDNIEILISCDEDDEDTKRYSFLYNDKYNNTKFYFIERDRNLHKRLNNLARLAKGKYIFGLNDDCEILTKNWDEICYKILEECNSDIIYGKTHDDSCDKSGNREYASFPIISKKAVDVLGFFMHERFVGLGGDVGIYRVYKEVNKVVDIPIEITHKLHKTVEHVFNPDDVAREMRENTYKGCTDFFTFDITNDVERILNYEKTISSI